MTTPALRPVHSSAIEAAGYVPLPETPGQGLIVLRFVSGGTYAYVCPSWMFGLLLAGKSTGRTYHKLIRGKTPVVRIQ